jgi:DNA adenine methylase
MIYQNNIEILKTSGDEKRLVTGPVLIPDCYDAQNDTISCEEIEDAAHSFMMNYRKNLSEMGLEHRETTNEVVICESGILPVDAVINGTLLKRGSWVITAKIKSDSIWQKIKNGEITGFSIGGSGIREEVV